MIWPYKLLPPLRQHQLRPLEGSLQQTPQVILIFKLSESQPTNVGDLHSKSTEWFLSKNRFKETQTIAKMFRRQMEFTLQEPEKLQLEWEKSTDTSTEIKQLLQLSKNSFSLKNNYLPTWEGEWQIFLPQNHSSNDLKWPELGQGLRQKVRTQSKSPHTSRRNSTTSFITSASQFLHHEKAIVMSQNWVEKLNVLT